MARKPLFYIDPEISGKFTGEDEKLLNRIPQDVRTEYIYGTEEEAAEAAKVIAFYGLTRAFPILQDMRDLVNQQPKDKS